MRCNADESGTTSERCFAAKANSARHSRPTPYDQDMAEIALVRIFLPWRLQDSDRIVVDPLHNGLLCFTTLSRDAQTGKSQITDVGRTFLQKKATLQTDKSDRQVRLYGDTHHHPRVGIQSRWYIERQDRRDMSLFIAPRFNIP